LSVSKHLLTQTGEGRVSQYYQTNRSKGRHPVTEGKTSSHVSFSFLALPSDLQVNPK